VAGQEKAPGTGATTTTKEMYMLPEIKLFTHFLGFAAAHLRRPSWWALWVPVWAIVFAIAHGGAL